MKRNKWTAIFAAFVLLFLAVPQTAVMESVAGETEYPIEYVYTSDLITAYYHLYGHVLDDFAEIYITNNTDETARFLVETEIDGYSAVSSDTVEAAAGETVEVRQNPRLIPESMEKLNAQRYANFVIHVTLLADGGDELLLAESSEILLFSRRDYTWVDGMTDQENHDLLAVYVTPNDPAVEELLRRAADYTDSGQITAGYSSERDENGKVWDRLEAVWKAEEDYDLTYVNTWVTFAPDSTQRVRMPFEVLEQEGGNCIELTFLYASAVEAMDMESAIVLVPGHAYLAVRTDDVNAQYYFVETTLIGQSDFAYAVNYGYESWEEDGPAMDAGEDYYAWVTIEDAREWGVLPVPWR
ncbi:MAG: hypothetical protein JW811_10545 [Clostridiales bacterium]|nr:hypothetical protein [Clostridiales bacterium]